MKWYFHLVLQFRTPADKGCLSAQVITSALGRFYTGKDDPTQGDPEICIGIMEAVHRGSWRRNFDQLPTRCHGRRLQMARWSPRSTIRSFEGPAAAIVTDLHLLNAPRSHTRVFPFSRKRWRPIVPRSPADSIATVPEQPNSPTVVAYGSKGRPSALASIQPKPRLIR